MTKPLVNDDLSDKPELPAACITAENDVLTAIVKSQLQLKRSQSGEFEVWRDKGGCFAEGQIT